jgi:hypothetical protein
VRTVAGAVAVFFVVAFFVVAFFVVAFFVVAFFVVAFFVVAFFVVAFFVVVVLVIGSSRWIRGMALRASTQWRVVVVSANMVTVAPRIGKGLPA